MKKYTVLAAAAIAMFATFATPTKSFANVYMAPNGVWMGNVCRNGAYYNIVFFQPVGGGCFMPALNAYGVITNE